MNEKLAAAIELLNAEIAKHRHDLQRAEERAGARDAEKAALRKKIDCKVALIYALTKQDDLLREQECAVRRIVAIMTNRADEFERNRNNIIGGQL
jgi:major membrane immunogen (membrane-anchored lipoprotein)